MHKIKCLTVSCLTLVLVSWGGVVFGENGNDASIASKVSIHEAAAKKTSVDLLFVQVAPQATLTASQLVLNNVYSKTIWFSDRPVRRAGFVNTSDFVKVWQKGRGKGSFNQTPPNAAMIDATVQSHHLKEVRSDVVELTSPSYNEKTKQLTYEVKFLKSDQAPKNIQSFTDVSLFIDGCDNGFGWGESNSSQFCNKTPWGDPGWR